ncbi:glycosyltransferase [Sphingomonas arantia]|uniref:Glycosyltransferase n=1 Tax=Sphingomonas arantia TaxID=1460676 RepID=A0ABW4U3B5_9SPHN
MNRTQPPNPPVIGAVVIGRNEAARLGRALASVRDQIATIVYVDSGSQDASREIAASLGVDVVRLPIGSGFTAARARNAGFARLRILLPAVDLVQFVDGDCDLEPGWVAAATAFLRAVPDAAVVCGRRRERFPDASRYNRLCDHEWDTRIGRTESCGGDALFRAHAFAAVDGFCDTLIAGEEPELCHRLSRAGWTIHRIDHAMTRHDAAMTRFGQWWQRNRRSGYAHAQALTMRDGLDTRLLRIVASNIFWSTPVGWPLWPLLWLRLLVRRGALYATYTTIGKLPHLHGQIDYWSRQRRLIEYK